MAIKKYLVAKPNWTLWWGGWGWAPERKRFRIYPVYNSTLDRIPVYGYMYIRILFVGKINTYFR